VGKTGYSQNNMTQYCYGSWAVYVELVAGKYIHFNHQGR